MGKQSNWADKLLKSKEFEDVVNVICLIALIAFIAYVAYLAGMSTIFISLVSSPNGCLFTCITFGEGNIDLCYDVCIELEDGYRK